MMSVQETIKTDQIPNFVEVAGALGYWISESIKNVDAREYRDQDSHKHWVVDSEKVTDETLDAIYTSVFLTGDICGNRSRRYRELLKNPKLHGATFLTVTSVIKHLSFGCDDLKLLSKVLAWIDGVN